jgi:hypothetical protein
MFYEVFGCLLDELVCILLLKYDGTLLEKNKGLLNANHQDSKQQEKSMYGAIYTP